MVVKSDLPRPPGVYAGGQKGKSVAKSGAEGGSRTHTGISPHRFLSSSAIVWQGFSATATVHYADRRQGCVERAWTSVSSPWMSVNPKLIGGQIGGQILGMGLSAIVFCFGGAGGGGVRSSASSD